MRSLVVSWLRKLGFHVLPDWLAVLASRLPTLKTSRPRFLFSLHRRQAPHPVPNRSRKDRIIRRRTYAFNWPSARSALLTALSYSTNGGP